MPSDTILQEEKNLKSKKEKHNMVYSSMLKNVKTDTLVRIFSVYQ